jgi:predicted permease
VAPLLGRAFSETDQAVAVISYAYWDRHFQKAPDVVGRKIRINGSSFTIIGVTPREFFGDIVGYQSDIWFPIEAQPQVNPGRNYLHDPSIEWLLLMGRLESVTLLAQAQAEANTVGLSILREQFAKAYSSEDGSVLRERRISVQPGAGGFSRMRHTFSKPLLLLMILVALVLLICCINVANLQLARATSRAREIGLRLAIGASRARLLRQLMTESLLLATTGALAGLLIAYWVGHLMLGLLARGNRLPLDFHLSGASLVFTISLSIAASLIFGLAPALYATKANVASNLKESKSGRSTRGAQRFEKGLVIFQVVLSWVLLFGAGLFIRTLQNLENGDLGYRREQLVVAEVDTAASGFVGPKFNQLANRLRDRLSSAPGIRSVAFSENGLFSGIESESGVVAEGFIPRSDADEQSHSDRVGPGYFETIGSPVLLGRAIEARDMDGPRVAILNESMARLYFPNGDPIGRRISTDEGKQWLTVIGVVRDAKQNSLRDPAVRRFYTQFWDKIDAQAAGSLVLEVRAQGSTAYAESLVRQQIKDIEPNLQVDSVSSVQGLIDNELQQERLIAKLSGSFSLLALVLAGIGLYGVMAYLTQRRASEMGIRMALGASRRSVVRMVLREALGVTSVGLAVGVVAAIFLGKLVSTSLYEVGAYDPMTAVLASITILAVALVAGWLPARRAARVDPMVALRAE